MIKDCPKCRSNELDVRGEGECYYGHYEFYEWYCKKCGYSEQEYYYDQMDEKIS